MRIRSLKAFHVRLALKRRIKHASHSRTSTDNIIVRCETDRGIVGWGEGLPRSYVTGDTIESVLEQFDKTDWTAQLRDGIPPLPDAVTFLSQIEVDTANRQAEDRDCFGNSLRCAVELSLLDAVCQEEDTPLSKVTEFVDETTLIRKSRRVVHYSAVVTSVSKKKLIAQALAFRACGFRQGKLKVGTDGIDDRALLVTARRVFGSRFDLRVDANEAWTCDELPDRFAELAEFGITSVEQPVPHREVESLSGLRERLPIPIMHDESLCSLSDAQAAIDQGTCDLFNIRLSKCGGFLPSLRIAALAHAHGCGYQLGCQVGESGILSAAGRHFACSVGGIRALEGSFDRFLVADRLTKQDLTFGPAGRARAIVRPGLGVDVDESAIARVCMSARTGL